MIPPPPRIISIRSMAASGMLCQCTSSPVTRLSRTPSRSTSAPVRELLTTPRRFTVLSAPSPKPCVSITVTPSTPPGRSGGGGGGGRAGGGLGGEGGRPGRGVLPRGGVGGVAGNPRPFPARPGEGPGRDEHLGQLH